MFFFLFKKINKKNVIDQKNNFRFKKFTKKTTTKTPLNTYIIDKLLAWTDIQTEKLHHYKVTNFIFKNALFSDRVLTIFL